jgi:hypothetical protein
VFGLSPRALIQLALALLQAFNWISRKIDEREWKAQGFEEALKAAQAEFLKEMVRVDAAVTQASSTTPEERSDRLDSDL